IQSGTTQTPTHSATQVATPQFSSTSTTDSCPSFLASDPGCFTPTALRTAYSVEPLIKKGFTGKGQTIIDIVSFGSPTLQQDMDTFDKQFGLPPIKLQIISPLNVPESDPKNDK